MRELIELRRRQIRNMNTCNRPVLARHFLPGPAADDFTPDDTVFPYNPSTPDPAHIFLIFPLFLLSLTLAFLQQEMYSRSRVFLPTRPSSTFDVRSDKLLTFRNPCFRYSSACTLVINAIRNAPMMSLLLASPLSIA